MKTKNYQRRISGFFRNGLIIVAWFLSVNAMNPVRAECPDGSDDVGGCHLSTEELPIEIPWTDTLASIPRKNQFRPTCVNNIETTFEDGTFATKWRNNKKEENPIDKFWIAFPHGKRLPPSNLTAKPTKELKTSIFGLSDVGLTHIQSIVRLPNKRGNLWFAATKNSHKGNAAIYIIEYPRLAEGSPFAIVRGYMPIIGSEHIGGMQAIGDHVAMSVECNTDDAAICNSPMVQIYNFSKPLEPILVSTIYLDTENNLKKVHWVGITHLKDGRFFVLANRNGDQEVDAYVSPLDAKIVKGHEWDWQHVGRFRITHKDWRTSQNVNLLTSCETGDPYLLAMRQKSFAFNEWSGDNQIKLFRISKEFPEETFALDFVSEVSFGQSGDFCEMRGGSGYYTEPDLTPTVICSKGVTDNQAASEEARFQLMLQGENIQAVNWLRASIYTAVGEEPSQRNPID